MNPFPPASDMPVILLSALRGLMLIGGITAIVAAFTGYPVWLYLVGCALLAVQSSWSPLILELIARERDARREATHVRR